MRDSDVIEFYLIPFTAGWCTNPYELTVSRWRKSSCEILEEKDDGLLTVKFYKVKYVERYGGYDDDGNWDDNIISGSEEDSICDVFKDRASAIRYVIKCKKREIETLMEDIVKLEKELL